MEDIRIAQLVSVIMFICQGSCYTRRAEWSADTQLNDVIPSESPLAEMTSENEFRCALACTGNWDCSTFIHVASTSTCKLYNFTWTGTGDTISVVSAITFAVNYRQDSCDGDWLAFRGSCYNFVNQKLNFSAAKNLCESYGGHLVHVDNDAENTFLKQNCDSALALYDPTINTCWIGLTDETVEGQWLWTDNLEPMTYDNWNPGQPNEGTNANCAGLYNKPGYDLEWVDEPCWYLNMPMCEIKVV